MLGKMFFKQQPYIFGLGDPTPTIMSFSVNEDKFRQTR